jgi:TPR repeat protein
MGFKRTSEGRVFFQGTEEGQGPAAKKADFRSLSQASQPSGSSQSTQIQILTLLKALNDKLKDAQTERTKMRAEIDAYRKAISELEGKTDRSERAYMDLEQKVGKGASGKADRAEKLAEDMFKELKETRKLILEIEDKSDRADKGVVNLQRQVAQTKALGDEIIKKQETYDELVKRLDDVDTKHDDLNQKIEKTSAEQSRILRQVEKVAEDRARFMRKIERIEETVIQTRDALSAKAMVLLTEQGQSRTDGRPSFVQQVMGAGANDAAQAEGENRWQDSLVLQVGVAAAVLAFGILGGWAVSKIREIPFSSPAFEASEMTPAAEEASSSSTATESTASEAAAAPEAIAPDSYAAESQSVDEQSYNSANDNAESTAPLEETSVQSPAVEAARNFAAATDDVGTIDVSDEKKLTEMLETDPDALAAELNKIEPGIADTPVPNTTRLASLPPSDANMKSPEKKPAAPTAKSEAPPALEEPLSASELTKKMKPDTALPGEALEIERQAYAGVPEAQHDLAAIYTAGQGGVKQDYKRALFWFRQAANRGIANASYNLGVLYHQGLGVKPDITEAIKWYKNAAAQGHPEAQYNLGIAYIEGIGVGYDPARAAENFEKAAGFGIIEAAYNLGLIYENGLLGEARPDQALKWYKTAADKGSPEAKEALEQLAKTLKIKVEDVNRVADGVESVQTASASSSGHAEQALTAQIQEYLMRTGLYPGPADGVNSDLTEDAIRSYQSANKLKTDGKASEDLLAHMLGNNKQ